jgi:twinkle protein
VAENGNLVIFPFKFGERLRMVKQRNITDKKDQRPTSGKQEKSLFGWQAIPDNQRVAYIVEGELDAMAMFDYGFPALSVPYGGGSGDKQDWIENEYENLDRFEEIFLCLDMDEQGKAATAEIISRLGAERCRVVSLPAKDANQCLIDGIETAEIARAVRASAPVDPEELRQMSSLYNEVWEFRESGGEDPGFYAPWEKSEKLFKFRLDELSIHNGRNGHCKTWGVGQLSLAAAQQGFRVCIASLELKPRRLAERIEKQAAGVKGRPSKEYSRAVFDWFNDKLWIFEHTGTAKADRIIEVFTYARKRYGIRVFVIDSLMKCGFNEDDYNGQKQFVDRLCDFKNKYSCHVMLVTHSRKADSHSEFKSDTKSDIKGTGAISDLADSVFIWWKNIKKMKDLENPGDGDLSQIEMEADEFLKCEKQRNGEWEGSLALWFDECCQFVESYKGRPRQYVKYSKTEAA